MKRLIFILIIMSPLISKAQIFVQQECGKWIPDSLKITDWQTIDTLKKPVTTKARNWVFDNNWVQDLPLYSNAVYNPCGSDPTHSEYQQRVCEITGIRQRRYRIYLFHYEAPEKSDYQKTVEKFKH